ncbi:hypothetical protein FA15DRAFT_273443 [Coprinopsis marcescibilis]|uniref:N-acetyltransferase domain-containing protein n=1 Tax=Coprinopsis marcescibilis TaxID=230819 RepID=A0A5C3KDV9_COPMA|nr:hypothetical protein FA15DRAFT_273443 [Coprinopsis marcescibilis]
MGNFVVERVVNPSDAEIKASVNLFIDLMKTDISVLSLVGNELELIPVMIEAMLRAGALEGEYYTATNEEGVLVGYAMWMPPGRDLFGTETQRSLGLYDFMSRLPEATKEYYRDTYMAQFPNFVSDNLGPTGKTDAWWLHQAMVRRDYHRQGICKAFVGAILGKTKGKKVTLGTTTTADENIAVYTGLGFKQKATMAMPSLLGDWPIHLFELRTEDDLE